MNDQTPAADFRPPPDQLAATSNPFAAARIRPGALAYRFPSPDGLNALVTRLAECDHRAAIVGPHGTGKSTLLATLTVALEASGRRILRLYANPIRKAIIDPPADADLSGHVVALDGYDQLTLRRRALLRRTTARHAAGLVVTSHHTTLLPTLHRTRKGLTQALEIAHLLMEGFPPLVSDDEIAVVHARHRGNLRETLFELYDVYERRRS